MTNKISKEFLFTELSIKIATLEMKIDKLLELALQPKWTALDHERGPARTYPIPEEWKNQSDDEIFLEENK